MTFILLGISYWIFEHVANELLLLVFMIEHSGKPFFTRAFYIKNSYTNSNNLGEFSPSAYLSSFFTNFAHDLLFNSK